MKNRIRINGVLYEAVESMNESKTRTLDWKDMFGLGLAGGGAPTSYFKDDTDYQMLVSCFSNGDNGLYFENDEVFMVATVDYDQNTDEVSDNQMVIIMPVDDRYHDYYYEYITHSVADAKRTFKKVARMLDNGISVEDVTKSLKFKSYRI